MSFFHFYLRNRQAIIPTVAMSDDGFYLDVAPVAVVEADRADELKAALLRALESDNPRVATPPADEPGSVVLDKLRIKRWEIFERQSVLYTVHKSDKEISLYSTGRGAGGMWEKRAENHRTFLPQTADHEIVEAIYEDMILRPEMRSSARSLPALLPPRLLPPPAQD